MVKTELFFLAFLIVAHVSLHRLIVGLLPFAYEDLGGEGRLLKYLEVLRLALTFTADNSYHVDHSSINTSELSRCCRKAIANLLSSLEYETSLELVLRIP